MNFPPLNFQGTVGVNPPSTAFNPATPSSSFPANLLPGVPITPQAQGALNSQLGQLNLANQFTNPTNFYNQAMPQNSQYLLNAQGAQAQQGTNNYQYLLGQQQLAGQRSLGAQQSMLSLLLPMMGMGGGGNGQ